MIEAVRDGLLLGLGLSALIGPVFFTLIQTSSLKGFKTAFFLTIGICLSDLFYITLTFIGLNSFALGKSFRFYLGCIGGVILIAFGLSMIFKKHSTDVKNIDISKKERLKYVIKGFAINALNPAVVFFWIATMSLVSLDWGYQGWEIVALFSVTLATVFSTDLLKSYIANRISKFLTQNFIRTISIVMGALLIVFGGKMIFDAFHGTKQPQHVQKLLPKGKFGA